VNEWYALVTNTVLQQRTGPFRGCQGVFSGIDRQFYAGGKISARCLVHSLHFLYASTFIRLEDGLQPKLQLDMAY